MKLLKVSALVITTAVSGCGEVARESVLAAGRITQAALKDTGRICTNGAAAFGGIGQTDVQSVSESDKTCPSEGLQPISMQQAMEFAKSQGYVIE